MTTGRIVTVSFYNGEQSKAWVLTPDLHNLGDFLIPLETDGIHLMDQLGNLQFDFPDFSQMLRIDVQYFSADSIVQFFEYERGRVHRPFFLEVSYVEKVHGITHLTLLIEYFF
jgi:hypothetical protein